MTKAIDKIGATAFIIAVYRALEKNHPRKLFNDDYAQFFINQDTIKKAGDFASIIPEGKEMIRYRVRFFNDVINNYVADDVKQIVMLGCGFDMRSKEYEQEAVQFFDVDKKAVLEFKQQIIAKNNISYHSKFVPCDYITDNLIKCLINSGFKIDAYTLFIWEGNIHYIKKPKVYDFLTYLNNNLTNFSLAFDYLSEQVINRSSGIASADKAADFFAKMGSPWLTGFDNLDCIREKTTMTVSQNLSMQALARKYDSKADAPDILQLYSTAILTNSKNRENKI